eukprot:TRINITY_DN4113_c0_g1_i1.p2 TRINITY_DN4113_c0_g1~~TRINITY_DN4113_c0_g1_i1.p2  ORF type:complete len:51 (-),score=15.50 TRINITY_DN4113_c0_g1_i1:392-544(-)
MKETLVSVLGANMKDKNKKSLAEVIGFFTSTELVKAVIENEEYKAEKGDH